MSVINYILSNNPEIKKEFNRISQKFNLSAKEKKQLKPAISELHKHFECDVIEKKPEEIYSKNYKDFFIKYGFPNILKNYYILSEIEALGLDKKINNILDIGSGPGVFYEALYLKSHENSFLDHASITMLDCSQKFIDLFDNVIKKGNAIKHEIINTFFDGKSIIYRETPTAIILSNSLSEMLRDNRFDNAEFLINIIQYKPIIIIIDYSYDSTINRLNSFVESLGKHYKKIAFYNSGIINGEFEEIKLGKIQVLSENHKSNVDFIKTILVPNEYFDKMEVPVHSRIILKYKEAWENHDVSIIKEIFSLNATYHISKNKPPLFGINEIVNYWIENRNEQANVKFINRFSSFINDTVYCTWSSSFFRKDKNKTYYLEGEFNATIKDGKIVSFVEEFKKRIE